MTLFTAAREDESYGYSEPNNNHHLSHFDTQRHYRLSAIDSQHTSAHLHDTAALLSWNNQTHRHFPVP